MHSFSVWDICDFWNSVNASYASTFSPRLIEKQIMCFLC